MRGVLENVMTTTCIHTYMPTYILCTCGNSRDNKNENYTIDHYRLKEVMNGLDYHDNNNDDNSDWHLWVCS